MGNVFPRVSVFDSYSWVKSPGCDHPSCENLVIANGRWSLTRIKSPGVSSKKRSGLIYFMEENFLQASSYDMLLCVVSKHFLFTLSSVVHTANIETYRKIPKISPGAYIFQRPFLRGLFLEGLIYGRKFAFQNRLD